MNPIAQYGEVNMQQPSTKPISQPLLNEKAVQHKTQYVRPALEHQGKWQNMTLALSFPPA
ncbi:hypothetical protein GCM10008938_34160 [Deinococcus roseus]|uniref:Uncharacterized protein n=1 Tax=Deinococcus roseus TaxID=392414 RepID=A0ABQ2D7X3_9DEIO|nr:hypothetical protein GCM10008938_34160 [Deinococcus roseus]